MSPMLEPFGELELEADLDRDERSAEPTLVERLREALCELEVEPSVVRADPGGGSWLPAELLSWCEADPACREELREFVAAELALARLSSDDGPDPFFTARVVRALPSRIVGSRLSPRGRAVVLSAAWAAAGAAAWAVLSWLSPEALWVAALEHAAALFGTGAMAVWQTALASVAVAVAVAVALASGRTHTPAR